MIDRELVDVTIEGAVLLGPDIVCDGFYYGAKVRIQSHFHADHMMHFDTSKGLQHIFLSHPTYDLLKQAQNADLPYHANIKAFSFGELVEVGQSEVLFLSSGHMLGSVQTQVTLSDGTRVGYSGDFTWPLEKTIEVDVLVIDSSGSPNTCRRFSQEEANTRLVGLVAEKMRHGPVVLLAHRGTLQRALCVLDCELRGIPCVASQQTCQETEIYQRYGYSIPQLYGIDSEEAKRVIDDGRYIRIFRGKEHRPPSIPSATIIVLSAYISKPNDPVVQRSENSYCVALSDHADFEGTLRYIEATEAKAVITDNTRHGDGIELAQEIRSRLRIEARPSSSELGTGWRSGI